MKVSYRKIKEFLPTTVSATEAAAVLTATGLEIEGVETVEDITGGLRGLVVGEITLLATPKRGQIEMLQSEHWKGRTRHCLRSAKC